MKNPYNLGLIVIALAIVSPAVRAQVTIVELEAADAGALIVVPPEAVPRRGTFYSWQRPWQPPLPAVPSLELTVYELAQERFLFDDRFVIHFANSVEPAEGDATNIVTSPLGVQNPMSAAEYGCGLWLHITASTNNKVLLTVHNTRQGQTYQIWSITNLSLTNWVAETNLTGASGDFTQTLIPMASRPILFFRASETRDYTVATNFVGLGFSDTGLIVPDSMGAVGPNHFVELLNGMIAVYDKVGNLITKTNVEDFFRNGTNYPLGAVRDPRILYDHESSRWVACALDQGSASYNALLAVSTNQSPTNLISGWTKHLIQVRRDNVASDFTTLGLDGNGLYVSMLHLGGDTFYTNAGHTVVAIKKPEIYQGILVTNRFDIYMSNSLPVWAIQPAVNFDPISTNAYAWFVAKGPPDFGTNYRGGAVCYRRLQWSGTNAAWADTNWIAITNAGATYRDYYDLDGTNVSVFPSSGGVTAPEATAQGGVAIGLHQIGSRPAMSVIRNGSLWTCQAIGLAGTNSTYAGNESGTNVDRSGVQWLRLSVDSESGTLSYSTNGRVCDRTAVTNAYYYYFPSLMVNCAGDMLTAFSGSSATNYIGAFYSWRLGNGVTLDKPRLIRDGTTPFTSHRWGDYSATTLDPTDDWTFWTVQEIADSPGPEFPWKTIIGKLKPNP